MEDRDRESTRKNLLLRAGALSLLFVQVNVTHADPSVSFNDIAIEPDSGITYRRTESPRDAIFDAIKSQPVLKFEEAGSIPMKTHGAPGVAVFDFDQDGDRDLYVTNGPGSANSLYSNQFSETGQVTFVDVSVAAGVDATEMDCSGVCYGDIDNDGDQDLYVLGTGEPNRLYENQGNGTFVDITLLSQTGAGSRNPSGCSMGDVNGDGLLDIVIANTWNTWDDRVAIFEAFRFNDHNQLFINTPGNVFIDVSETSGIQDLAGFPEEYNDAAGITWAIAMVDYDLDGDTDIVMVDDQGEVLEEALGGVDRGLIHLMKNDGTGHFKDVSVEAGVNVLGAWMSLSFGDLNSDGNMDMFVTSLGDYMFTLIRAPGVYELGTLSSRWFLGETGGTFSDPGVGSLVATPFGWGSVIADYDNDGDSDIVFHGGLDVGPIFEASNFGAVLNNNGSGEFSYDLQALANSTNHSRRNVQGVASGDLNNDGFVDVVSVSSFDIPEEMPLVPYPKRWAVTQTTTHSLFPPLTPSRLVSFNGLVKNQSMAPYQSK